MPYEVRWYYPQRILLLRVYDTVTVEDIGLFGVKIREFANEAIPPMYTIIDALDVKQFPTNLNQLRQAATMERHPNVVWTILVSQNKLINFITSVFTQLSGVTFRAFDSMEAAVEFIALKEPSLNLHKEEQEI